jgi:hypothetical protein
LSTGIGGFSWFFPLAHLISSSRGITIGANMRGDSKISLLIPGIITLAGVIFSVFDEHG